MECADDIKLIVWFCPAAAVFILMLSEPETETSDACRFNSGRARSLKSIAWRYCAMDEK